MPSESYIVVGQPADLEQARALGGPTVAKLRQQWGEVVLQPAVSFQRYLVECRQPTMSKRLAGRR